MVTLTELRARAKLAQQKPTNYDSSAYFSFKNLKPGDKVRIRFVPDGEQNDWFWRPRSVRPLHFSSIRLGNGTVVNNHCNVSVPAFNIKKGEMNLNNLPENYLYYSKDDVVHQKIKGFWNDTEEGKALYNKFGKRDNYIMQGFVRSEGYETKLYRFSINKDLFQLIYSFMSDEEIMDIPSDPIKGRDFILNVTEKSASINGKTQKVKDYTTSKWSSNVSPLTDEELAWLKENKPYVLKDFISPRPSSEQEYVMLELFESSYNDEPYDYSRWYNFFKPDNVLFDDDGNIKDTKTTNDITNESEILSRTYTQPVYNSERQMEQGNINQVGDVVYAPYVPNTVPTPNWVDPRVYQPVTVQTGQTTNTAPVFPQTTQVSNTAAQPSAPQLIKENTVEVSGDNPTAVINDIMSKFKIPQQ